MTKEKAIKFANCLKNNYTIDFNDMADFCDMVIKALEPTMDKAMIHTLAKENDELKAEIGRLRQALEEINEEQSKVIDCSEIDIQKFNEAIKLQPPQVVNHLSEQVIQPGEDCINRTEVKNKAIQLWNGAAMKIINLVHLLITLQICHL